ncbi:family 78 glycoside hydrolase catalytic domain [Actinoplanes sp. NPDC051411]|uniref:alpha-L-rhamnosidase n=1 Tax=Actinoplanes sp. NPDC051411 TaxID=3155522 RepID=UPI003448E652
MTAGGYDLLVAAPRIGPLLGEHFVPVSRPALSWRVQTEVSGWVQRRAFIRLSHSDRDQEFVVEGAASVAVPWPFAELRPRERGAVQVRVEGGDGRSSDWSPAAQFTAGFLDPDESPAAFVGGTADDSPVLLRAALDISRPVRRALLYATALGVYQVEVNGRPVDDAELKPGWTSYQRRSTLETTDVTDLIRAGENVVGVRLAGGWLTERWGFRDAARRFYQGPPAVAVRLHLQYEDGTARWWDGVGDWRCRLGPSVSASLYQGETYDQRGEIPGWSSPASSADGWEPATRRDGTPPVAAPRTAPEVRVVTRRPVVDVLTTPSGKTVLDFGENLVGVLHLRVDGPAGTEVVLRHAEVLEHGEIATRPLRNAAATDRLILAGTGPVDWRPTATFHGFRYAQVDGWPGELRPGDIEALVLASDLESTGGFTCSSELVNQLHDNVGRSMRGNFLSIPTDCPQRDERLGWTGDIQVFAPTAAFLADCLSFLASWLADVRIEEDAAGGVVPIVVPAVLPESRRLLEPIAAWGDAITVVPWTLYDRFGDQAVLRDNYPAMRAWTDVLTARAGRTRLWDSGHQIGDWLDPDAPPDRPGAAKADPGLVATAYFFRSAQITAETALIAGTAEEAERYAVLRDEIAEAFRHRYVTPSGLMVSDAPTAYALALGFGLVTDPERMAAMGGRLAELVRASAYRISTGFVGTPLVCDALTMTGHTAAAARLLLQTECPSWLYPVTMGATTVWERWDSLLEDGTVNPGEMTSFNHYALGAVADWLHRVVAGLAPAEPGYRRLLIRPTPLPGLDHAEAWHDTPYGRAVSGWRRRDDVIDFHVTVPPGAAAHVQLPSTDVVEVGSGEHTWTITADIAPGMQREWSLDSDLADVVDDPQAYAVVVDALAGLDPQQAAAFRKNTRFVRGTALRKPLEKIPRPLIAEVERRLAELTRVRQAP